MSIFPTEILLAPDGSEKANLTTQTAVDMAEKTGTESHVGHAGASLRVSVLAPKHREFLGVRPRRP